MTVNIDKGKTVADICDNTIFMLQTIKVIGRPFSSIADVEIW